MLPAEMSVVKDTTWGSIRLVKHRLGKGTTSVLPQVAEIEPGFRRWGFIRQVRRGVILRNPRATDQLMYQPPFGFTVCPVIYAFPASITTTEAISSTVPNRPIGITLEVARGLARNISVSTSAGQTVFAV